MATTSNKPSKTSKAAAAFNKRIAKQAVASAKLGGSGPSAKQRRLLEGKEKTTINQDTNEVVGLTSGKVLAKGSNLQEALAKQTQLSSGGTPSVSGRPDLYATAPTSKEKQESYFDKSTQTTVKPRVATTEELKAQQAGSLESFNKAQGLTYLDMPTFESLQPLLTESDLIRGPKRQIWLKQGLTPDQVQARQATAVGGTTGATGETITSEFSVDVPEALSTDLISELTTSPVTDTEFSTMMESIQAKQEELLGLMAPSGDELAIKEDVGSIKAQIEKSLTELSMGLNNIEDQPIAMQFITGQQASVQRSAEAKLQNLARIEENLLYELGLEQEARSVKASVAQTQLGYLQTNLDTAFKVKQMIQQEEDSVFNRAMALKADARNTFSSILDSMQGMDETDMTADQQKQLQDLAISSGIPYSLVVAGLSNVKKQLMAQSSSVGDAPSSYQEWALAGGLEGTGKTYGEWLSVEDDLSTAQRTATFNSIVNKFNSSPLIAATDRLPVLEGSIAAVLEDPESGPNQLSLAYSYIQALDTYQSAVREGELSLVNSIDSKIGSLQNSIQKINDGKIVRGDVAKEIAESAQNIVDTIKSAAERKAKSFASQASVSGVGSEWNQYLSGFSPGYLGTASATEISANSFQPINQNYSSLDSLLQDFPFVTSVIDQLRNALWDDDMILQGIEQNGGLGFNSVGSDTQLGAEILNKVLSYTPGEKGGQCGAFVNDLAGTRMGDSYFSKMSYVNIPSTKIPSPGDIFVMPYKSTGHTGFVVGASKKSDGTYDVLVQDSNWGLDEKVKTHIINSSKLSGYARLS